jgi:FAD/FMN-containing dehydrogenase
MNVSAQTQGVASGFADAPSSEPESFGGKVTRFLATGAALLLQILLSFGILLDQLARALFSYPVALVRVWLPRHEHALPEPLHGDWFENAAGNQFARPVDVCHVTTLEQLRAVVRAAENAGKRVHAIGSGHSFSDVAVADGVLVELRGMKRVTDVSGETLGDAVATDMLVRAEAGVTIRELNRALHATGRALVNMGGYDGQTLGGVLSTSTHGSGMALGPLCDMVRSVDLVVEGGKALRIEPARGISAPEKHAAKYGAELPLLQDDELFYSVVVALGSLGVVHSYVIEVRPAFLLAEHREVLSWARVREKLAHDDFQPERGRGRREAIRHFEFLISPYGDGQNNQCLVTYRWEARADAKTHAGRSRPFLATLLTSIREFDGIYALALSVWPRLSRAVVNLEIKQLADKLYVAQSYQVLFLGDANYVPAYSSELSFSAEEDDPVHGPRQHVRAIDALLALAEEQARHGRYHNVPLSVRFVAASPHLLALSQGRKSAIIEIPLLAGVPGGWDLLRFYERRLFEDFRARAHWGQANFIVGADRIRESYPGAFDSWLAARARLCPQGTFDNSFTERMGLRALTQAAQHGKDTA